MEESIGIRKYAKRIIMILFFLIALMLFGGYNSVKAADSQVLEFRKKSYNENTKQLIVDVVMCPNISFKEFNITFGFNESYLEIIPFNSDRLSNSEADFNKIYGTTIDGEWSATHSKGRIDFTLNPLDMGSESKNAEQVLCEMKFQIKNSETVLEEDLSTDWFWVDEYYVVQVIGEDEVVNTNDDSDGLIKINQIESTVESITANNVQLDKNEYNFGDTITITSGTAIIKYSNTTKVNGQNKTRTVDLNTLLDENGNYIKIFKGTWEANSQIFKDKFVKLNYRNIESNEIPVIVKDYIEDITVEYEDEYEYGEELDKENIILSIKKASSNERTEKTLAELEEELGSEITTGFDSYAGPKQTISQEVTINIPDYKTPLKLNLTIVDKITNIEWVKKPNKTKYKYGENLDVEGGQIKVIYKSTQYNLVDLIESMVTEENGNNFDSTIISKRNLKVTYSYNENNENKNKILNYEIEVEDYIEDITVEYKDEYEYGEELDKENIILSIKKASSDERTEKTLAELEEELGSEKIIITGFDSYAGPKQTISQQVTINIPDYEKPLKLNLTIVDKITNIEWVKKPNKTKYKYGENLDVEGGQIKVIYKSTQYNLVDLIESMVTEENGNNFDSTIISKRNLKVTYSYNENNESKNKILNYEIEVKDYIADITVEYEDEYEYGEELDKENIILSIKMASGKEEIEKTLAQLETELGSEITTGFDSYAGPKQTISQEVTINVPDYEKPLKLNLTIVDKITNIEWVKKPNKTTYKYGENLDVEGGQIKVIYKSTQYNLVDLVESMVTEENGNNFDSTVTGTRDLIVTYPQFAEKTLTFEVTVNDYITDIEFNPAPPKNIYKYGEKLNTNGGKLKVTYKSGKEETIDITEDMVTEENGTQFDSTKIGKRKLKVTYSEFQEKSLTYPISVEMEIESIEITNDKKTIKYGHKITNEELQNGNYKLIIKRKQQNDLEIPITIDMIKYDPFGELEQTVHIIYEYEQDGEIKQKDIPFYITLENYITDMILNPDNIKINYGQELDYKILNDDYTITVRRANGETITLLLIDYINLDNINIHEEGIYTAKVIYENITREFKVRVVDSIIEIKLEDEEKEKIQKEYKYGEEINLNNAKLTIVKLSGESKIDLTKEMIENYNSKEIGVQNLNIKYKDQIIENAIEVEVKDYVVDIELVKPSKTTYLPGETLDLTGATVKTVYASGKFGNEVAVAMEMIFGYKEGELGTQRLTVKYEGFEKSFDVIFTVQTGARKYQCLWNINNYIRNIINRNICYNDNAKKEQIKITKKCNESLIN